MTTRVIGTDTYSLLYDGALHLTEARKNGVSVATFRYDGDGQMVEAEIGAVTTRYVGGYFEWRTEGALSESIKYYSAGSAWASEAWGICHTARHRFCDRLPPALHAGDPARSL